MSNFSFVSVSDLVVKKEASIQTGPFGTQLKASDYVSEGYPVINVRNIGYGNEKDASLEYINNEIAHKLRQHKLEKHDIVFGRKGAVDRHLLILHSHANYYQGSDCIRLRISTPKVISKFLSYFFQTEGHKRWMEAQGSFGATMGSLNQGIINRINFPLPPLPIQRKIAAILSAYDELIENNNRRIAILEKMAEEIYREWFVRLRFPGHKKVKVVKGVPEGWEVKKVGEVYKTSSGGTPSRNNARYYNGNINWLKTGELKNTYTFESEEKIAPEGLENSSAKLYGKNTVVIAMYCAMEDISILAEDASTNQACCAFLPSKINIPYLFTYYQIKFALPHIIAFAHGAAQQNLSQEIIKSYSLFLPHMELIDRFAELVQPLHSEIKSLMLRNMSLKKSRDLLLPRLISGKLEVENLDIAFPPGMEEEAT